MNEDVIKALYQGKESNCRNGHVEGTHGGNFRKKNLFLLEKRLARQRGGEHCYQIALCSVQLEVRLSAGGGGST